MSGCQNGRHYFQEPSFFFAGGQNNSDILTFWHLTSRIPEVQNVTRCLQKSSFTFFLRAAKTILTFWHSDILTSDVLDVRCQGVRMSEIISGTLLSRDARQIMTFWNVRMFQKSIFLFGGQEIVDFLTFWHLKSHMSDVGMWECQKLLSEIVCFIYFLSLREARQILTFWHSDIWHLGCQMSGCQNVSNYSQKFSFFCFCGRSNKIWHSDILTFWHLKSRMSDVGMSECQELFSEICFLFFSRGGHTNCNILIFRMSESISRNPVCFVFAGGQRKSDILTFWHLTSRMSDVSMSECQKWFPDIFFFADGQNNSDILTSDMPEVRLQNVRMSESIPRNPVLFLFFFVFFAGRQNNSDILRFWHLTSWMSDVRMSECQKLFTEMFLLLLREARKNLGILTFWHSDIWYFGCQMSECQNVRNYFQKSNYCFFGPTIHFRADKQSQA